MSKIHTALIEAMREIAKIGIAKTSKADLGGARVNYRGIEAAMNEMSLILIKCGINVTPSYSDLSIMERAKGEGKATRFVTLKGSFTFAADDGSHVVCTTYGEAMDSGDKATIKAQSVAFRTALFQQFVVPTMAMDPEEGGDDEGEVPEELLKAAREAAMGGWSNLAAWIKARTPEERKLLEPESNSLKKAAKESDAAKAGAK